MIDGKIFIGGAWTKEGTISEVINPAKPQEVLGTMILSTAADVDRAVAAAGVAASAWKALGFVARGNLLFKVADAVDEHLDELARLAAEEMGKPISEARGEALRAVAILRYYAGEGYRSTGDVIPASNPRALQYTTRDPLGVVAIVTPWNFPLAIPMWKMAPALIYGNTVVLKPAEWASLSAIRMCEIIGPILPSGVLNLVTGLGRDTGEALIQHPGINGISFTGSSEVGGHIADVATRRNVKYQTEMGGKNPVIVADDADLNLAVEATVSGAMRSAGQKCTATSRVIVVRGIHDAFIERLISRVKELKQGDPLDPDTYLGPVVSASQFHKVVNYINVGQREGGQLLWGGDVTKEPLDHGFYVPPTIFDGVAQNHTIAQDEIFGPVVGVITANSLDEAIQAANNVRYGLSASVFTTNLGTALKCVSELNAGLVRVNEETAGVELQAPFGGMKASSSHSREQGRSAIEFYTQVKTVFIRA